jgi:hypothetical protein
VEYWNIISSTGQYPDPDPPDLHVFVPPGFGSISHMYAPDLYPASDPDFDPCLQAKKVRKTLILLFCDFFWNFLSLKNYVNVPSKSNKQKNYFL